MKKNQHKKSAPDWLLPLPDAEGIKATKELYKEKFSKEVTDEEAMDILGRAMRYIFLVESLKD